jgi:hypothetical protein
VRETEREEIDGDEEELNSLELTVAEEVEHK